MTTGGPVAALERHFGNGAVANLVPLTGGASRETWRVEIDGVACIAQRQRAGAGAERSMAVEARVLAAVSAAGVPVAPTLAFVADDGGDIIVSAFTSGETIPRRILRDERFERARPLLVGQLATALARIHRADVGGVDGLPDDDVLAGSRRVLHEIGHPHPALELALRWLDAHRPAPPPQPALVHGDFRLGNLIVDDDGLVAVIDWELCHLGDPMEDLGWLCVPSWRFGSEPPVAGLADRDELFEAYTAERGVDVDPEVVRWWEVCGILRWGVMCLMQVEAHRSGQVRSHELAAIGRRVGETEHDLFLALEGRW